MLQSKSDTSASDGTEVESWTFYLFWKWFWYCSFYLFCYTHYFPYVAHFFFFCWCLCFAFILQFCLLFTPPQHCLVYDISVGAISTILQNCNYLGVVSIFNLTIRHLHFLHAFFILLSVLVSIYCLENHNAIMKWFKSTPREKKYSFIFFVLCFFFFFLQNK